MPQTAGALITMETVGAVPRTLAKQWSALMREEWRRTGHYWHDRYREKHFTRQGGREYKYTRRKGELMRGERRYGSTYTGRKEKRWGHTRPLVFTGFTRRLARQRVVRPTRRGVKIPIRAPGLNRRHPKSRVNMAREMRTVSRAEVVEITRNLERRMQRAIRALKQRTRV